ncbi:carboxypeptidase-like regulatory domain-containing protein [Flavobacteriaceae bacterium]|nr:carboxypeptidase-like regulatory domain-containing protein [Flavobacteriaceae bacterium]
MKKQSLFLTLLGILMVQLVFAQQKTITGNITDESGLPLPGASIIIENTTRGVATDFDGKYSITASEGDVLVFSFVGFISQRITVGASDVINVNFQDDSSELQEVIVTAYGTQKRESIAGAVSVIKSDQIENATWYDVFYTNKDNELTEIPDFSTHWFEELESRIPKYEVNEKSSNSETPVSKGWFLFGHNAVGITFEIGDETPKDRIEIIGKEAAKAMMNILSKQ